MSDQVGRSRAVRRYDDEGPVERTAGDCSVQSTASSSAEEERLLGHAFAAVSSEEQLLGAALPFLDEGLRTGDLVALSASPETVDLVTRELGEPARQLAIDPRISLRGS